MLWHTHKAIVFTELQLNTTFIHKKNVCPIVTLFFSQLLTLDRGQQAKWCWWKALTAVMWYGRWEHTDVSVENWGSSQYKDAVLPV